jgi:hypothetical protein
MTMVNEDVAAFAKHVVGESIEGGNVGVTIHFARCGTRFLDAFEGTTFTSAFFAFAGSYASMRVRDTISVT